MLGVFLAPLGGYVLQKFHDDNIVDMLFDRSQTGVREIEEEKLYTAEQAARLLQAAAELRDETPRDLMRGYGAHLAARLVSEYRYRIPDEAKDIFSVLKLVVSLDRRLSFEEQSRRVGALYYRPSNDLEASWSDLIYGMLVGLSRALIRSSSVYEPDWDEARTRCRFRLRQAFSQTSMTVPIAREDDEPDANEGSR